MLNTLVIPRSRVGGVGPNEEVVFLVGDKVHPAHVHGLVAAVEANVALFGLARVSRGPDDQPLYVIQYALVLAVSVGHDFGALVA